MILAARGVWSAVQGEVTLVPLHLVSQLVPPIPGAQYSPLCSPPKIETDLVQFTLSVFLQTMFIEALFLPRESHESSSGTELTMSNLTTPLSNYVNKKKIVARIVATKRPERSARDLHRSRGASNRGSADRCS